MQTQTFPLLFMSSLSDFIKEASGSTVYLNMIEMAQGGFPLVNVMIILSGYNQDDRPICLAVHRGQEMRGQQSETKDASFRYLEEIELILTENGFRVSKGQFHLPEKGLAGGSYDRWNFIHESTINAHGTVVKLIDGESFHEVLSLDTKSGELELEASGVVSVHDVQLTKNVKKIKGD